MNKEALNITAAEKKGEEEALRTKLNSNPEFKKIGDWLSTVSFRKKVVGGLDPVDVWEKIEELNRLYENALIAERTRYNLMVQTVMAKRTPEEKNG